MPENDYCLGLYQKMKTEQHLFRDWLLTQPPEKILDHAFQYAMKEDIMAAMEAIELSPKQAKALLKSPCPLEDVYKEFRNSETGHMEEIHHAIEFRANEVAKRESTRESR